MSPRRSGRFAALALVAALLPLPSVAASAAPAPAPSDYGKVSSDGRPTTPNPYLAITPQARLDNTREDVARWDKWLATMGAKRAEAVDGRRAAGRTIPVTEVEDPGTLGVNDTPATAETVPGGFGSDADPEATISGVLATNDAGGTFTSLPVPAEDDGDLNLATPLTLDVGDTVEVLGAAIGDGPHGSGGSATGDFDAYAVAMDAGETLFVDAFATSDLDGMLFVYDSTGTIVDFNDDDFFLDPSIAFTAPAADTYTFVVAGFYSELANPFDSSTGSGAASEGTYDLYVSVGLSDVDVYAVSLEAGDVLGATVEDFTASVAVVAPDQTTLLMRSFGDASFIYGQGSPLVGGGSHLAIVADVAGTYYVSVQQGAGPYTLRLQAFRPGNERLRTNRQQTVFLDFDGAVVPNADQLWGGFPNAALSPLSAYLDGWGLTPADEDDVIDAIVDAVTETLEDDLRTAANGDRDVSGVHGEFDVEVLNSRDHADTFGSDPAVSRVIVGGSIDELGVFTIGIAQSIDPGNFAPGESGVVLLDLLSEPGCGFGDSLNCFVGPNTDMVELIGQGVGNIAAHEAGHLLGSFHTDQFNATPNIMDQGGNLAQFAGAGDDQESGTGDDIDLDFVTDEFVPNEGFEGFENTRDLTAFALATGTDTVNDAPTAADDEYEFTGGPLVIGGAGLLANDVDPEFDALVTSLTSGADRGDVTLGDGGAFVYTPTSFGQTSFTYTANDGDLDSNVATATIVVRCGADDGELRNGSFEIGVGRWCRDKNFTDVPWSIAEEGTNVYLDLYGDSFGIFDVEPTDGDFAAVTTWDGFGSRELSQFFAVPQLAEAAELSFDWRAGWDLATFCFACTDNDLTMVVRDALTGDEITSQVLVTAVGGTAVGDTGPQSVAVDVTGLAGRFLQLQIVAAVSSPYDGPALVQVDNVRLTVDLDETPVTVGDAYAVPVGGTLDVVAADGVLANDTDVEGATLVATLVDGPTNGTLDLSDDGAFTYVHDGSSVLLDTFTYIADDGASDSPVTTVVIRIGDDGVVRLSGEDRIATAVAISQSTYPVVDDGRRAVGSPQASAVVLARADEFADGLAGTPLAALVDAPMLLTFPDSLHPTAAAELQRVLPEGATVHLLGGEVALSADVADAVAALGFTVDRIAGDTRYDTAVAIADRLGDVDTVLVARGDAFPDALAAGPAAIVSNGAILLTTPDAPVAATTDWLADHTEARVVAVGGPAAAAYPDVDAIVGPTRHDTAVLLANEFFDSPAAAGLARSDVFADALAGGVHVGRAGGPILLTPSTTLDTAPFTWFDTRADDVRVVFAYGGPVALSDEVLDAVRPRIA